MKTVTRFTAPVVDGSKHSRSRLAGILATRTLAEPGCPEERVTIDGHKLSIYNGLKGLNKEKIKALLESSFGKVLVDDYFEHNADCVIVADDYSAIAIMKTVNGVPYLDKLAVDKEAQGNGIAKAVWSYITEHYPCLIWRATKSNPINPWYFKNSDGTERCGEWTVFWYGLEPQTAHGLIQVVADLPVTLVQNT